MADLSTLREVAAAAPKGWSAYNRERFEGDERDAMDAVVKRAGGRWVSVTYDDDALGTGALAALDSDVHVVTYYVIRDAAMSDG